MSLSAQKKACIEKMEVALEIAKAKWPEANFKMPRIEWSTRMTRCAGMFGHNRRTGENVIKLSVNLLQLNGDTFINDTPVHELAHYVDHALHGSSSHGYRWKAIMRMFGQQPNRCHNMETPVSNRKKYSYVCGCTTHMVGGIVHNKINNGAQYHCRKCKLSLRPA